MYWQQSDSESYSQNRRSDETQVTFENLILETVGSLTCSATTSVSPKTLIDPEPVYKVLAEAKLALCAGNSGASAKAIELIDSIINASPTVATPSTTKAETTGEQL